MTMDVLLESAPQCLEWEGSGMQGRNVTSLVSFRGREVNRDSLENQERPG